MQPRIRFQYESIAQSLKDQILRGDFSSTGKLPSERELVNQFHVQRNTVRQALGLLEKEGQIRTEGKRGSFVQTKPAPITDRSFLLDLHEGSSPDLLHLQNGFRRAASEAGLKVKRFNSQPPMGAALDPIPDPALLGEDVSGVAIWPQNPTDRRALTALARRVPTVLVDRRVNGLNLDSVRFADVDGGRLVTDHLVQLGHRKIGFISDEVFAETVQNRWHGYALSLEQNSVPVDPRLSLFFHGIDALYFANAIRHLLGLGPDAPTAIVCSNDVVAFTLIRFLHDEGLKVPDDICVTGYGDIMPDYTHAMSLTTVHQPFYDLGCAAAKILIDRMAQLPSERQLNPIDLEIPVKLVIRGSSGGAVASPKPGAFESAQFSHRQQTAVDP